VQNALFPEKFFVNVRQVGIGHYDIRRNSGAVVQFNPRGFMTLCDDACDGTVVMYLHTQILGLFLEGFHHAEHNLPGNQGTLGYLSRRKHRE
jgi:hypothetical protein